MRIVDTDLVIKPCPFCKGKAVVEEMLSGDASCEDCSLGFDICCMSEDCHMSAGMSWDFETAEEAVASWNKRVE